MPTCSDASDAPLLVAFIQKKHQPGNTAPSGLLGGLLELRPDAGWPLLQQILTDRERPFSEKLSAVGTLRFCHASKPEANRVEMLRFLATLLEQGDLADMAIEVLRRWQWRDLTNTVPEPGRQLPSMFLP